MNRISYGMLLASLTLLTDPVAAQQTWTPTQSGDVRVVCESRGFGRQVCPSNLRGFTYSTLRNLSGAACELGRNFGYDDNGVWVDQGCRGEFVFSNRGNVGGGGYPASNTDRAVACESRDGRQANCPADLYGYVFRDLKQVSRTQCILGTNFGYDERGVWVNQGCRGEFYFQLRPQGSTERRAVRCESRDGRRTNCAADLRGYGLLDIKQRSRTTCTLGRNFGYDERGVWVDQGCRGDFNFSWGARPGYGAPGTYGATGGFATPGTYGNYPGSAATNVTCESVENRRVYCALPNYRARVRMSRQLSRTQCTEGENWGVDNRGIWVDDGCRAEFEVSN